MGFRGFFVYILLMPFKTRENLLKCIYINKTKMSKAKAISIDNQTWLNKYNISTVDLSLSGKRVLNKLVDFYKSKAMKRSDLRDEAIENVKEFVVLAKGKHYDIIRNIYISFTTPTRDCGNGGRPRKYHIMSAEMEDLYFGD